jgi:hypothetical protein
MDLLLELRLSGLANLGSIVEGFLEAEAIFTT